MLRRIVSGIVSALLLVSMLILASDVQPVKATGTIYIQSDGTVAPPTAPIQRFDDIYVLTGNVSSDGHGIVIERKNIVVDGDGYALQGSLPFGSGFHLWNVNNVTVQNAIIQDFYEGIYLSNSSFNTISGNNITNNSIAIELHDSSDNNTVCVNNIKSTKNAIGVWIHDSSKNLISGNTIINNYLGVWSLAPYYLESLTSPSIPECSDNSLLDNVLVNNTGGIAFNYLDPIHHDRTHHNNIVGNIIASDDGGERGISLAWTYGSNIIRENRIIGYSVGVYLDETFHNVISRNNITNNGAGIELWYGPGTKIFHSNFVNNTNQVNVYYGSVGVWDDGYPSGGNYWSNYTGVDLCSGPFQNDTGNDGIGDTPYIINANNTDNYPLIYPTLQIPWDITGPAMWVSDCKCDIRDIATVAMLFGSAIGDERYDRRADLTGATYLVPDGKIDIRDIALVAVHYGDIDL